jgi:hypothetical protein
MSNLLEGSVRIPVKDKSNPQSVINLAPTLLGKAIDCIPDELFSLRPDQLAEKFRLGRKYDKETEVEEKLRFAFWREYDHAVERGLRMNMERICAGVCTVRAFMTITQNSFKLAYICTPPDDYTLTMQELLKIGLDQMRDILLLPHIDERTGRPDPRMCEVKMKIIDQVTLRVKGSVASRIETKNLNVNIESDGPQRPMTDVSQLTDPEEIDRRLKELMGVRDGEKEVVDVTPTSEGSG